MMYWQLIEYALIGVIAGILSGLLGIGGGIVIIPALVLVFSSYTQIIPPDQLMHYVVGTSFATIMVTTLFSLRAQYRRGTVFWPIFSRLFMGVAIGTILGTCLASILHTQVLKTIFAVFMILIALQMFFHLYESTREGLPRPIYRWLAALFIGGSSGLLGIGGGALTIPYLTYFKVPIREAMAASTACSVLIAFLGAIGFMITGLLQTSPHIPWTTGYIFWPAAIVITIVSPLFVKLGNVWSNLLPVETLRKILAGFILLVGIKMLF